MAIALNRLSVAALLHGMGAGDFSAQDVVRACLARIADRDGEVRAWAALDPEAALGAGGASPARRLGGVPFGVKDVLDTRGLPTQMGSTLYVGAQPRFDAGVVGLLRQAGGVVLGKTATAEFAGTAPADTTHPLDPGHTPGGSSSGSGAAVADFMVPFALGTQTGGSVLRPAAFCGIVGFKPSFGSYPTAGMKPAAHSFDTIGSLARTVEDVALVHGALMRSPVPTPAGTAPRLGLFRTHLDDSITPGVQAAMQAALAHLGKAGARMVERQAPDWFATLTEARSVVNAFERYGELAGEALDDTAGFQPKTAQTWALGADIDGDTYLAARRRFDAARVQAAALFDDVDLLVMPSVPAPAPAGLGSTGDPRLLELWTALHLPALTLPVPVSSGLPVGMQLIAPLYDDDRLLALAAWVERALA